MNKYNSSTFLLLGFIFALIGGSDASAQKISKFEKIQKITSEVIKKAFQSSVKISAYDTLKKRPGTSVFSGVVVSADGHILTAAHAAKPGQVYQVTFPDGRKALTLGLGRIAVKNEEANFDLAMLKISDKGNWPFAELGSSRHMKVHQPAISISYPGSFSNQIPNVRIGRLTNVDIEDGYFETTCKMEPGDSGGPVFDADGRVLGIHSFIKGGEEYNFEVPVDLYRKYWSALNVPEDYKTMPEGDVFNAAPLKSKVTLPNLQDVLLVPDNMANATYNIKSKVKGNFTRALATLISYQSAGAHSTYLLSKNTLVGDTVMLLKGTQWESLKVIARDTDNDLVLLQPGSVPDGGIQFRDSQDSLIVNFNDLGRFLVSGLGNGRQYVSVLSSRNIDMPMLRQRPGYFGANATFIDEKITITDISRGSPASRHLKLQDQVTGVNGKPIDQPEQYGQEFSRYKSGDSITVELIRENKPLQVKLRLTDFTSSNHIADRFEGGKSIRSTGYKKVLVHDAAILAEDCGGPVFDGNGRFYGINIARHSRTSTIIMPVDAIFNFIKQNSF